MDRSNNVIAKNLKEIRARRNLSFDQLSRCTGVSKSMLRQIETGKSNPTISTMWKIANGLHLSFTALLQNQPVGAHVRDFTEADPLYGVEHHYRVYPLVTFDPRKPFEMYYFELDSGAVFDAEPHQGGVKEYIFLFTGTITVQAGEHLFTMESGSFVDFKADCIHRYSSSSEEISTGLMTLSYTGL